MTPVRQRADRDCGVAALATIAEIPYEDAYFAVGTVDPHCRGKSGLHNRELVAAAAQLGITLQPTRRYDLDDEDGILRIRWNGRKGRKNRGGHFVAIRDGIVLCPADGFPMRWAEYLERNQGRPCSLLRVIE
jgi:ABC-type bacteriocin/lantibiotic exporter with double-glycine peptidase domain